MTYDDLLDPYGAYSRLQPPLQPGQRQPITPMAPEEEESYLSKLGSKALGGLGYVGSVLEKTTGARALRGLLGGKPRELLSILPGSDMSGLTNEEDRVSGKELLGLKDEDGFLPGAAGIAAEIALDPSTYVGLPFFGGALTKAGGLAKAAGVLPKTIAERAGTTLADLTHASSFADLGAATARNLKISNAAQAAGTPIADVLGQRLGGLLNIGIPGFEPATLGASDAGVNALNKIGDAANWLGHVSPARKVWEPLQKNVLEPAGRYAGAWFNAANKGVTDAAAQVGAQQATGAEKALQVGSRGQVHDLAVGLSEAGLGDEQAANLRRVIEGVSSPTDPSIGIPLNAVADRAKAGLATKLDEMQKLGYNPGELIDQYAEYGPRGHTLLDEERNFLGQPRQQFQARDPRIEARDPIFKNIPGGTEGVLDANGVAQGGLNPMSVDPQISGPARLRQQPLDSANYIREKYLGMGPEDLARYHDLSNKDFGLMQHQAGNDPQKIEAVQQLVSEHAALKAKVDQSVALADWTAKLHPAYAETGNPWFNNNPLNDLGEYHKATDRIKAVAEAAHDMVAAQKPNMVPLINGVKAPPGYVSIPEAMKRIGLDYQVALQTPTNPTLAMLSGTQAAQKMVAGEKGVFTTLGQKMGMSPLQVQGMAVPESFVDELTRFSKGFSQPESTAPVLAGYDWLTKTFKAATTAPWPSHQIRNLVTDMFNNVVKGAVEPGLDSVNGFIKPMKDAYTLHAGGVIADANKIPDLMHLTPEAATAQLGKEMYQHNVLQRGNFARDATEGSGKTLQDLLEQIPGQVPAGLSDVKNTLAEGTWDPRKIGLDLEKAAPVEAGRKFGETSEATTSGALYLAKRRQGFSAEAAANEVRAAHGDYGANALSPVERNVFKRLAPFYSFTKQNLPRQLEQLIQSPGGLVAQEAKVASSLQQDRSGFQPDYLGGGLALPVGSEQEGTQRYLTGLGTPVEAAFSPLAGGAHPVQDTLMRLLGETNPVIKGPLEFATGKQFYSGRDLADLHPSLGSFPGAGTLEQFLMNTPASKLIGTGRTLLDERKWESPGAAAGIPLNLLTGARVSDVDVDKARSIAARDYITEALRGRPEISHFESLSARPGMPLTTEEMALLRLNRSLEQQAAKKAKAGKIVVQP